MSALPIDLPGDRKTNWINAVTFAIFHLGAVAALFTFSWPAFAVARQLTPPERDRFVNLWHQIQARFVDDPAGSTWLAALLVYDVMLTRGYPMADFDHRAEDISVDHPMAVQNYRAAHEVGLSAQEGRASTEDLRKALVNYRDLFEDMAETQAVGPQGARCYVSQNRPASA